MLIAAADKYPKKTKELMFPNEASLLSLFLDAKASPTTYPCQSVGQWVSEWVIVSDLVIAIASPSFASLFLGAIASLSTFPLLIVSYLEIAIASPSLFCIVLLKPLYCPELKTKPTASQFRTSLAFCQRRLSSLRDWTNTWHTHECACGLLKGDPRQSIIDT